MTEERLALAELLEKAGAHPPHDQHVGGRSRTPSEGNFYVGARQNVLHRVNGARKIA